MKRILAALCFLLMGPGLALQAEPRPAPPEKKDAAAAKPVTVPFELLKTKHITIQVKINGKGPYRVIFDTGAPVTLINNKVALESGMLSRNAPQPLFTLFGSKGPATIKKLEVGGLAADNVAAVVMDHPTLEMISKALGPIEGIVGFPFFARYRMTLDYQAKELTFVPNGYDPPDAMQAMMAAVMTMVEDKPAKPRVLAPAAQWGLLLHKGADDDDAGITINEVLPGSAAAAAGLQPGDRLLTLDGRWTDTLADAFQAAARIKPGMSARALVKRHDKDVELTIKPVAGM